MGQQIKRGEVNGNKKRSLFYLIFIFFFFQIHWVCVCVCVHLRWVHLCWVHMGLHRLDAFFLLPPPHFNE